MDELLLRLTLLLTAGAGAAWLAERCRMPRLVGALLAGVLLGPVFAATAPQWHEKVFLGASDARESLDKARNDYEQGLQILRDTGITEVAIEEHQQRWKPRLAELEANLETERTAYRRPLQALMLYGVAPLLLMGLAASAAGPHEPRRLGAAFPTALAAPLLGGVAGFAVAHLLRSMDRGADGPLAPLGIALACAAVAGPLGQALRHRLGTNDPRGAHAAAVAGLGMVLSWIAIAVLAAGFAGAESESAAARWAAVALTFSGGIVALGLMLLRASSHAWVQADRPAWWRWPVGLAVLWAASTTGSPLHLGFAAVLVGLLVVLAEPARAHSAWLEIRRGALEPMLVAYAGWHFTFTGLDWLAVLLIALAFCDAKALGALLVARATAPKAWPEAFSLGTTMASGGASAIVVALLVHQAGWIDAPLYSTLVIANFAGALCAGPMITWMLQDPGAPAQRS